MKAMRTLCGLVFVFCAVGPVCAGEKGSASRDGFQQAEKDVADLKLELKEKTAEQLIGLFVPSDSPKRYGGYDYYYKYKRNLAIIKELESRGQEAQAALRAHTKDRVYLYEAANGPGDTVGDVCSRLLRRLEK